MARRSGEKWFVGVMNGLEARKLTIPTGFLLPKKKYTLTLYQDDPKMETRTKVAVSRKTIKGGDSIRLDLLASGGAAMEIEPLP